MGSPANNKEPKIITNWRIAYKEKFGGIESYLDIYKNDIPFDLIGFKDYLVEEVSKGNISSEIAAHFLKRIAKRWGDTEEVPIYESLGAYPYLKSWSNRIEVIIPAVLDRIDIRYRNDYYILKKSPYIITKMGSLFNGNPGRTPENKEAFYIALSPQIAFMIHRLGIICSRLFDIKNKEDADNMEKLNIIKLMNTNIERDPDILNYLKGLCYQIMFFDVVELDDENMIKWLAEELLFSNYYSSPELPKANAFFYLVDPITQAIGLFLIGHEYAHILLRHLDFPDKDNFLVKHEREHQADGLAYDLAWLSICQEFKIYEEMGMGVLTDFYFLGIEILFNFFNIIDRLCGIVTGMQGIIISDSHPKAMDRISRDRKSVV